MVLKLTKLHQHPPFETALMFIFACLPYLLAEVHTYYVYTCMYLNYFFFWIHTSHGAEAHKIASTLGTFLENAVIVYTFTYIQFVFE